jgi:hypothetical protein
MKTSLKDLAVYLAYTRDCDRAGVEPVPMDEYFDGGS